jgi:hypothetical protein
LDGPSQKTHRNDRDSSVRHVRRSHRSPAVLNLRPCKGWMGRPLLVSAISTARKPARHALLAASVRRGRTDADLVTSALSQVNNRIDSATGSFLSDCDATTYCHENNTCAYRGCRKDEVSTVIQLTSSGKKLTSLFHSIPSVTTPSHSRTFQLDAARVHCQWTAWIAATPWSI